MLKIFYSFLQFISIASLFFLCVNANAQIDFTYQSQYKYLKGSNASGLSSGWMNNGFNDSGWSTGNAPFRYGNGTGGVELDDMRYNYTTVYMRTTFDATNASMLETLTFTIDYDDAFAIWINGELVLNQNAPASFAYNDSTLVEHESGAGEVFLVNTTDFTLLEGQNYIAIQGFNLNLSSSDFYFDMAINAETNEPRFIDTLGVVFSYPSGFYDNPFSLTITSPYAGTNLKYTLDGSNPGTSSVAFTAGISASFTINPASTTGRVPTPGVVVRASITKPGYRPSISSGRTYIFIDSVLTQKSPGGGWPGHATLVNEQEIDLEMDSRVVDDPTYESLMDDALLAIPTLSIITDNKNLFDPASGIYVNAGGHGFDWEKECTFELFKPDNTEEFNVNAGLRIRGGWSRHGDYPKHSFRLFFRSEYGDAKLNYPLFGDEGVSQFDKIDLRTEQNYGWSAYSGNHNTMVREVFSRDTQRDMGQPYTRSRYYHLYLNGMYWGIYQTQERSEARFAADYFGGKAEDYDVVKISTEDWSYQVEATDGNLDEWQKIWDLCASGFAENADYFKLQGKNENGNPVKDGEILIDIDNLIDYMLTIFYAGNFDAPTSSFGSNKGPNNYYAIKDRTDKSKGYVFYNHDGEHALFSEEVYPGIGLNEDRVNIGTRTDWLKMEVNSFQGFHPQWLHFKLCDNIEYRMRFADRAYKALTGSGVMTTAIARDRFNSRASMIETAIIAESARWGDTKTSWWPYTKNDTWVPELNKVRNVFFPSRTQILIDQLKDANLYSALSPPTFKKSSTTITAQKYALLSDIAVSVTNTNSSGTIYYTIDGTDPRLVGGDISASAIEATSGTSVDISSSTILKARIYDNGSWSALKHVDFLAENEDFTNLKVTELNYHPEDKIVGTDTTSGKDYEYIEFKNIGETSINLTGLVLDSAVYYEFPTGEVLGPKQFYVIATKPSKFYERYGLNASGNCSGNFANSEEEVLLTDADGQEVIHFTYEDSDPWPEPADGLGFSLVSTEFNPTGNPNDSYYWRESLLKYGSPFKDDDGVTGTEEPLMKSKRNVSIYPNPSSEIITINLSGDYLSNKLDIKLYTISSELVYQAKIDNHTSINLSNLGIKAGMYLIRVETQDVIETSKIIYSPY